MDPAGPVCAGSTRRSNLTGLRVRYYSVPGKSESFFFLQRCQSFEGIRAADCVCCGRTADRKFS